MNRHISFFLCIWISLAVRPLCQTAVPAIPDSLLMGAKSVVIAKEVNIDILAIDKYTTTYKKLVKVLDSQKSDAGTVIIHYDKLIRPDQIEIIVRDSTMRKIKSYGKSDMTDHAWIDGVTFATDDRYLKWQCGAIAVPFFIEVSYRLQSGQTFIITPFLPVEDDTEAVLHAEFKISNHDKGNRLYFNDHPWGKPAADSTDDKVVYRFDFSNIKPPCKGDKNREFFTPVLPVLTLFSMDGVQGDLSTWATFGNWLEQLNKGQDKLNEKAMAEIKHLIGSEKDPRAIIDKLYNYLQESTRYISIQLGVGGWRPLSAQFVHENKYGDCKALSNYMKALLQTAGINSFYTVLKAGKNARQINENLVSNQFNHAILMVPLDRDTVFLECTSDKDPSGYLGTFTSNRKVLYINGENSGLATSTRYPGKENRISGTTTVQLDKQNTLIEISQNLTGVCTDLHGYLDNRHMDDLNLGKYLNENVYKDSKNLKVLHKGLVRGGQHPEFSVRMQMSDPTRISINGTRYFVQMDIDRSVRAVAENLIHTYVRNTVRFGFMVNDTVVIKIPLSCKVEKSPKQADMSNEAGSFKAFPIQSEGEMRFVYELVVNENRPSAGKHAEELYAMITKALGDKTVVNCQVSP